MNQQLYIYAIVKNKDNATLPELVGLNSQKITFIPYQGFMVVASKILLGNLGDLGVEELKTLVAIHEKVNEWLIKDFNVIPLKFGTVVKNEEALFDFLKETHPCFLAAFEEIDGKAEFVVETLWNEKKIIEEIAKENPEVQKLKQKAESQGKILGLPAKIKLGKLIIDNIELRRKEYVKDILNFLKNYASDNREGKILNKEAIMSYSFLIHKSQESEFETKLNQLGEKYQYKLRFKYIGPMAPYSFVNITFASASKESIKEARRILGVSRKAAWPEIRIAYHKLASKYHPDKNSESEEAEEQMKKIIRAYKFLEKVYSKKIINNN